MSRIGHPGDTEGGRRRGPRMYPPQRNRRSSTPAAQRGKDSAQHCPRLRRCRPLDRIAHFSFPSVTDKLATCDLRPATINHRQTTFWGIQPPLFFSSSSTSSSAPALPTVPSLPASLNSPVSSSYLSLSPSLPLINYTFSPPFSYLSHPLS